MFSAIPWLDFTLVVVVTLITKRLQIMKQKLFGEDNQLVGTLMLMMTLLKCNYLRLNWEN